MPIIDPPVGCNCGRSDFPSSCPVHNSVESVTIKDAMGNEYVHTYPHPLDSLQRLLESMNKEVVLNRQFLDKGTLPENYYGSGEVELPGIDELEFLREGDRERLLEEARRAAGEGEEGTS